MTIREHSAGGLRYDLVQGHRPSPEGHHANDCRLVPGIFTSASRVIHHIGERDNVYPVVICMCWNRLAAELCHESLRILKYPKFIYEKSPIVRNSCRLSVAFFPATNPVRLTRNS